MIGEGEWPALLEAPPDELKSRVFSILADASRSVRTAETDDPDLLGLVPRLWDLVEARKELAGYRQLVSAYARSCGLWNYVDIEEADGRDALVASAVTVPELGGLTLHREQVAALNVLLAGRNLILSAPTSFGKSLLIDALLASGRFHRVAVIVPTIALLDETRRRLSRRFGATFQLVMYGDEQVESEQVIFLGTQERLINRTDIGALDLLVVDEFYKLDPNRQDDRSVTLNSAVYRLLKSASQFFFLGPNIENVRVAADNRWKFEFLHTRFSTVAVNTIDLRGQVAPEQRLIEEAMSPANLPALVFASSPDRANLLANDFVQSGASVGDGIALSEWIDENFGPEWEISSAIRAGIGVHHGRVPRALAARLVHQFNQGSVPVLICTSTLIEGVNTAAKSVLIYDKQINRSNYDFFTYSNIRGRAGRLGQHHVGNVYLFHGEPERTETEVDAPLFGDLNTAPDDMLIYLDPEDRGAEAGARYDDLRSQLAVDEDELRTVAAIGIETALEVQELVLRNYRGDQRLNWYGFPSFDNLVALCEIITKVEGARKYGLASARQLAFYVAELRKSRPLRSFFRWHMRGSKPEYREGVFRFLRGCEYGLPQIVAVVEIFSKKLFPSADYSLLEAALPTLFRPIVLKHLDEQGVPIQISERFYEQNDNIRTLTKRLLDLAGAGNERLSKIEIDWILASLGD
jgi:hypothetical protein